MALGFTIPNDYQPDTVITVEILWESPATQCDFVLLGGLLFRARDGLPRDFGFASGGITALRASTPFTANRNEITMAAPDTAHQTASVRFTITTTPGEFPTLQRGDAVNFGISRSDDIATDTCNDDLGIAGISIVYNKNESDARVSLNPASVDFGAQAIGSTGTLSVTLTNSGKDALTLRKFALSQQMTNRFMQSGSTCTIGLNVVAGASCTFVFTSKPRSENLRTAEFQIQSDAPGSPHVITLMSRGVR